MASGITVILDVAKLNAIQNGLGDKTTDILDNTARNIEDDTKDNIMAKRVIDTGALFDSIHVEPGDNDLERIIADAVDYGIYNEMGTVKMPARPFMGPAVENNRKPFIEAFKVLFE